MNRKEYLKAYQDITNKVQGLSKMGFNVDEEWLKQIDFNKNITQKNKQAIQGMNYQSILEHTYTVDRETGEQISYNQLRSNLLSDMMEESSIAIENFRVELQTFDALVSNKDGAIGRPMLESWLDTLIDEYGEDVVADMLAKGRERGILLQVEMYYDAKMAHKYMYDMMNYLQTEGYANEDDIRIMMNWLNETEGFEEY